jgi:hypothetical protein
MNKVIEDSGLSETFYNTNKIVAKTETITDNESMNYIDKNGNMDDEEVDNSEDHE